MSGEKLTKLSWFNMAVTWNSRIFFNFWRRAGISLKVCWQFSSVPCHEMQGSCLQVTYGPKEKCLRILSLGRFCSKGSCMLLVRQAWKNRFCYFAVSLLGQYCREAGPQDTGADCRALSTYGRLRHLQCECLGGRAAQFTGAREKNLRGRWVILLQMAWLQLWACQQCPTGLDHLKDGKGFLFPKIWTKKLLFDYMLLGRKILEIKKHEALFSVDASLQITFPTRSDWPINSCTKIPPRGKLPKLEQLRIRLYTTRKPWRKLQDQASVKWLLSNNDRLQTIYDDQLY